mmetsp:Transcript_19968/g.29402  ORF Transcript_19968/g.29402 Transcript_19968/m.29402 type:complete len:143 (+) Transcript_19968:1-429(+)
MLLSLDLLFTFPIVFSSGRQIAENALIGRSPNKNEADTFSQEQFIESESAALARACIAAGGILICFSLAQIGGFGTVANLVGGVAQGTLAFILPPLIAVTLARKGDVALDAGGEVGQLLLGLFGVCVVSSVSYFTIAGMLAG